MLTTWSVVHVDYRQYGIIKNKQALTQTVHELIQVYSKFWLYEYKQVT